MASFSVTWILVSLAVRFSTATPSITFPLNSQVPPVARIGEPFSFVFSQSTFTSPLAITYSLANTPSWLSIDSEARRLFGTPQDSDVPAGDIVGVPVTLMATDETGSATLDATLVVSRETPPNLEIPIGEQIPGFGIFSSPNSILAPPDSPFSFQVLADTFTNPSDHRLNYYAVTLDHTPLPAWVVFDPETLSFTGRTPPFESLIQPPQAFGLQLVASDVEGFSAASLDFTIVVGNHQITASRPVIELNGTIGKPILYTTLRDEVQVDGQPATPDNSLIQSTTNIPPWITVDMTSWQISGTAPESAGSTNFTVTLADKFSDALNISFVLEITDQTHSLLNQELPVTDVIPGEEFLFDLRPSLAQPEDTEMSISGDLPSWIETDPDGKTISGLVPLASKDATLEIAINLRSKSSGITDSARLILEVVEAVPSNTVVRQPPAPSATSIKAPVSADPGSSPPQVNVKLLAILLPILLLAIAAIILFIWWYRRRRREQQEPRIVTREISEPLPGSFVVTAHGLPGSGSPRELGGRSDTYSATNDTEAAVAAMNHEEKEPMESRTIYQSIEGQLMVRPSSTVRLIPSTERLRAAANNLLAKGRAASLGSRSAMSSRRGRPTRGNSTLSSISETTSHLLDGSLGVVGGTFLELPNHNGSASSFRGDIEINIPALCNPSAPPESTYTGDESSWTDAPYASSPPGSSHGDPRHSVSDRSCEGPDVMPLRTVSRLGNYPPAPSQKFSWPWNKRTTSVRGPRVPFLSRNRGVSSCGCGTGRKHICRQTSLRSSPSTTGAFTRRRGEYSRGSKKLTTKDPNTNNRDSTTTAGISFSQISFPRTPTLPELPVLPSLIRPVTRRGEELQPGAGGDDDEEGDDNRRRRRSSTIPGTAKTTSADSGGGGGGRRRANTVDTGRDSVYTANNDPVSGNHNNSNNKNNNDTGGREKPSFIPETLVWTATKGHSHDSLGIIYSDLVKKAPFHPSSSGFWSSAPSTPARKNNETGKEPCADGSSAILPPNWAVMEHRDDSPSPLMKRWGATGNAGVSGDEEVAGSEGHDVVGGIFAKTQIRGGSPIKSPELPSLSGATAGSRMGSGGLRLVEPSSSIRGPPSEADVISINTVDYWKGRVGGGGAASTAGPGSSVMSIPRDMTPARDDNNHDDKGTASTYWNKLGDRMFSRGEGVSWTADLGKYSSRSRVQKKSSKGKGKGRGGAGSISRVSIISEGNGKDRTSSLKERDAAGAASLASASKSSVGGSHYYI